MKPLHLSLFIALTFTSALFAHGEDKSGPHGGFIRMPGTFHTEVVSKKGKLYIYLLDLSFENPTVKDSSVSAKIVRNKKESPLVCKAEQDRFVCELPKNEALSTGTLTIHAKRGDKSEGTATYDLPLKLAKPPTEH